MAASAWTGFINFGLVSIPVRLYPAARKDPVRFHQIHSKCHTRLKRPLYCPTCERMVERTEVVKGFEYEKNQYILVEPNEISQAAPASSKSMEIMEFVALKDVDPLYFNASYWVAPEESGQKPYRLLLQGMEETGRAAIAKVTMHEREYLVVLRPRPNSLALHTMYFENEIRYASEYTDAGSVKLRPQEVSLAKQLIGSLEAPFEPAKYRDEYEERLRKLLEMKQEGKEIVTEAKPRLAPVVDMMEALKKSLAARSKAAHPAKVKSKAAHRKAS